MDIDCYLIILLKDIERRLYTQISNIFDTQEHLTCTIWFLIKRSKVT